MTGFSGIGLIRISKIGKQWLGGLALMALVEKNVPTPCLGAFKFVSICHNDHLKSVLCYRLLKRLLGVFCRVTYLDFCDVLMANCVFATEEGIQSGVQKKTQFLEPCPIIAPKNSVLKSSSCLRLSDSSVSLAKKA